MAQQYFYRAMDSRGRVTQGQLDANNVSDLEARLERMGLDLIHYHTKRFYRFRVGKVGRQELITFCFHLEHLTRAGVPLLEGLSDLRDSLSQSRFREIVSNLYENIQGGERLSEALSHFPDTFDTVFVSLVRAGEESGRLNEVFKHLTETLKWHDELVAKSKKLMLYPTFMGTVIIGVLFFVMIYLVPKLTLFIQGVGAQLPLHTRTLIFVSELFVKHWVLILLSPVFIFLLFKVALRFDPRVRRLVDRLKLRMWIFGPIVEKIILARFATFFALLYKSGITVLDSLHLSQKLVGNLVIEEALRQVTDRIADGVSITESFDRARLFPPLVLRMIKVGEVTGELDSALSNISYFYDREVKDSIEKIQTLLEPALTVILGLLMGWIILSVLGPIYDVITKFNFR